MMKHTKSLSTVVAIMATTTMLSAFVPSATAVGQGTGAVASARSFKVETAKKNLFQEAVSTTVDGSAKWTLGGSQISNMSVPQTQSPAEQAAAKAKQEREAAQAAAAAQQQAAASRSEAREPLTTNTASSGYTVTPPNGATAAAVVSYAEQFVGKAPYRSGGNTPSGWDCSGFVQYVFASVGISLLHYSGSQATAGRAVPDIAQAQPGDILANSQHSAIYIGGGMVVNALNEQAGTTYTPVAYAFSGGYSIRRLL